jgi:DNA-binding GntR family transcriptional regulator
MIPSNNTLREKVAESLREAIVKGEIKPGTRLQEVEIAESYKTSRTPVREAFRQLETEGFLAIKPRRGAIVTEITARDIREFYEMKSVLEGYAARKAAETLTDAQIDRMEQLNLQLRECYDKSNLSSMISIHNQFHEIFVNAAGNEQMASLIRSLVNRFQRYRIALSHTDSILESVAQHERIIAAFRARDAEQAASLVSLNSQLGSKALMDNLKIAA